jgi:hypothetical protein
MLLFGFHKACLYITFFSFLPFPSFFIKIPQMKDSIKIPQAKDKKKVNISKLVPKKSFLWKSLLVSNYKTFRMGQRRKWGKKKKMG